MNLQFEHTEQYIMNNNVQLFYMYRTLRDGTISGPEREDTIDVAEPCTLRG